MVKKIFEAAVTGREPPEFGHDAANFAQAVSFGNLHPDAVAIAGHAALSSAVDTQRLTVREKDQKAREFMLQIARVDAYLSRMDDIISSTEANFAVLVERRIEFARLAQEAYERSFEADDLIKAIKDGISPEERERLIELLGPEAATASADELTKALVAEKAKSESKGDELNSEAERVAHMIDEQQERLDALRELRDEYKNATLERRQQIEEAVDKMNDPKSRTAHAEYAVSANPNFNVIFP